MLTRRFVATRRFLLLCQVVLVCAATASAATNSLTISESAGKTSADYPIQVGRPFVMGEIPDFPQALVNGVPVTTQADVKSRWPDGSVKHAILTFLVPTLNANSRVTVTFRDQAAGNNNGYLTAAQMLDASWDFDAQMLLTNGGTVSASARAMVAANAFTYWLTGPVATSVVIADHGSARSFDIGFDANRSFRPIFEATFFPAIKKVRVRFIGEIANTEALQDQVYALALKLGYSAPSTVYTKASFTHCAATRWTKEFWIGGAPSTVSINHNLAYLAGTNLVPNFDTSKKPSESSIAAAYSTWGSTAKDITNKGLWQPEMSTAGGRPDIGLYPAWTVRWLYTGDWRAEAIAFGQADLAAAWPMHFREGRAGRPFDRAKAVPALGKVLSINARPTIFLGDGNGYMTNDATVAADKITPVGAMTNGGWRPDGAHQPDMFTAQYLLTGEHWYLEESLFWASWGAAKVNPGLSAYWGRGPTGSEGGIQDEVRGQAWIFRNRCHTASVTPDAMPEQQYLTALINDAIAIWEGARSITGSPLQGTTAWTWGKKENSARFGSLGPPTLHQWEMGEADFVQTPMDPAVVKLAHSPWEQNFMMISLGRARELGYPTDTLIRWFSLNLIGQLTDPGFNPYLVGAYRIPTVSLKTGNYFRTFADLKTGYLASFDHVGYFNGNLTDPEHGYPFIALAATAFAASETNGTAAWQWMSSHALGAAVLSDMPKWALLPRAFGAPAPSQPANLKIVAR